MLVSAVTVTATAAAHCSFHGSWSCLRYRSGRQVLILGSWFLVLLSLVALH